MPYTIINSNFSQLTTNTTDIKAPVTNATTVTPAISNGRTGTVSSDHASLSSTASLFSQTLSGSGSDSDVRMEKVTSLQESIAAGTYHVSASAVAEKMLSSMLR